MPPTLCPTQFDLSTRVAFRENIATVQRGMEEDIAAGVYESTLHLCTLKHYFTPIDSKFGSYTYAREMTIPEDTIIIGKIHRHQHLNIISKGSVMVATEHGDKYYTAPCTFVSEVGTKRAVHAKADTIWTTIHTVSYGSEADLDKIEAEVIAPSYEALDMIATTKELNTMIDLNPISLAGASE